MFPDPNDRTINQPALLIEPIDVVKICHSCGYNQTVSGTTIVDTEKALVTTTMKNWFIQRAANSGWAEAEFVGSQCFLKAKLTLVSTSSTKS